MDESMYIYGADATSSEAHRSGMVNGTLIMDLRGWNSHTLSAMVFAILAQEVVSSACLLIFVNAKPRLRVNVPR
jgi:hypothetical protein